MLVAKRIRRPAILMDATVSVVAQQVNNLSSQNSMDTTVSVVSSEQVSVVALEQVNNSSSQNSMNISVASGSRPFRVIQHVVNGVASLFRQSLKNFMANVAGEVDENVGDNKDEEVDEGEVNPAKICSICLTIKSNCVLYKCGHTRFCFECANMQWKTPGRGTCPICKACIEDVVRTF